jgi:hypothetical protein
LLEKAGLAPAFGFVLEFGGEFALVTLRHAKDIDGASLGSGPF